MLKKKAGKSLRTRKSTFQWSEYSNNTLLVLKLTGIRSNIYLIFVNIYPLRFSF